MQRRMTRKYQARMQKPNYYTGRSVPASQRLHSSVSAPVLGPDMRVVYEDNDHSTRTDRLHRRRADAKNRIHPKWGAEGIRTSIGYSLLLGLAGFLLLILLWGRINVIGLHQQNSTMRGNLSATQVKCAELRSEIETAEKEIFVGYEAVDIGLVSDIGVQKETLVAPSTAIVMPH